MKYKFIKHFDFPLFVMSLNFCAISRLMFVADSSHVLRANMDGTNTKSIVSEAAYKASGIAVDIVAKRVFWCDSLLDYIETVDYDGNRRHMVLRGMYKRHSVLCCSPQISFLSNNCFIFICHIFLGQSVPSPSRLTVFENRVFWSDGTKQGIMSVDKFLGTDSMASVYRDKSAREPRSVKAVHSLIQKPGELIISH